MVDKTLVLIRGAQGSGKTTLAKMMQRADPDLQHYEADDYFTDKWGRYKWNVKGLPHAHEWTQWRCKCAMQVGLPVCISNTSTTKEECQPYYDLAEEYGYGVWEIICRGEFPNDHGVPAEIVQKKRDSLEL